jgi:hypothetical protein
MLIRNEFEPIFLLPQLHLTLKNAFILQKFKLHLIENVVT